MQGATMKFIVLDFDGTAAHFGTGGSRGWFPIFTRRGVSRTHLKEAYRLVRGQGFSIQNLLCELQKKIGRKFDKQKIHQEFEQWLTGSLVLYPDTLSTIQQWQHAGILVFVLSAGEAEYQMQKIRVSQIPYDKIILTSRSFKKAEVFMNLMGTYGEPAVFIDDRPDVLDEVRRILGNRHVITVWIQRTGGEYANREVEFSHIKADRLNAPQIQKIILGKQDT